MKEHIEVEYQYKLLRGYHDNAGGQTVAIITHGIGGNKLGHKYIFKQFADACVASGISTLRLDFIGSGESDGDFANTKHSDQAYQLDEIVKYAIKLNYKKIYLVSTTIGCYSTWHCSKAEISGIINWNPIVNFERYLDNNLRSATPDFKIDLNGLFLNASYIEDLRKLEQEVPQLDCPILCLQGELDFETQYHELEKLCAERSWEYLQISNANHLWEGNAVRAELFRRTINFIEKQN